MIVVEIDFRRELNVPASPEVAFALLSDVGRSGGHFPGVQQLSPVGADGRWRWLLKERGFGPIKLQACYEAIYRSDPEAMRVDWAPPPRGAGNMESSGSWEIEAGSDGGSHIRFWAHTRAHVPGPRLLAGTVESIAIQELRKLKSDYVTAIERTLSNS